MYSVSDKMNEYGALVEWYVQEKSRRTCPSAALYIINPTCSGPRLNPGLHGEGPATKPLNHGTAHRKIVINGEWGIIWNELTVVCFTVLSWHSRAEIKSLNFPLVARYNSAEIRIYARRRSWNHAGFWWGSLKEKDHLEDPSVDDRVTLKGILKK
jgi:hypothetical protein